MKSIAIVGAGMAGCYLAQRLGQRARATVFEKSRGPAGRLSTRRGGHFTFDHGAQFFTARTQQFLEFLKPYLSSGLVQGWKPKLVTLGGPKAYQRQWFEPHFVAVPQMTSWLKEMAASLDVRTEHTITASRQQEQQWLLQDEAGSWHGPFDWVISTAPAAQTAVLFPALAEPLAGVQMAPCFAWLLGFPSPPRCRESWDAAVVQNSPLSWLAWNQSRPGRDPAAALVVHSSNEWARDNLDREQAEVEARLAEALQSCAGIDAGQAVFRQLHRWRYASTTVDLGQPFLADTRLALAAAGDWCLKGRLEGAFLSAYQLAEFLVLADD